MRFLALFTLILLFSGCGNSVETKKAAAEIEKAFANSDSVSKQNATAVSQALREGQFDQAVVSLTAIQSQRPTNSEQLQAIQNSSVALQAELSRRIEAGDEKAKAAYKLLQELRRN